MISLDFRLEPADEYTHEPSPEINFNESVYVNAFDGLVRWTMINMLQAHVFEGGRRSPPTRFVAGTLR